MKTHTKFEKIVMLWLNSGYIFVSYWEGNTISSVLGTYLLLFFKESLSRIKWFNRSGSPTVTGHIRKCQCWGYGSLGCCLLSSKPMSPELARITWHFTAWGVLFVLARWLYLVKSLGWKALFYWIDFKKYYTITHTSFLCVTQECGFSNYEMCYLQPRKVLFDSSGNPLWTSPDYNFDFAL